MIPWKKGRPSSTAAGTVRLPRAPRWTWSSSMTGTSVSEVLW